MPASKLETHNGARRGPVPLDGETAAKPVPDFSYNTAQRLDVPRALAPLPDAAFTAAVMRRVQAEEAQRLAPTQDATSALTRLDRRAASPRTRRWRWTGVAAGS